MGRLHTLLSLVVLLTLGACGGGGGGGDNPKPPTTGTINVEGVWTVVETGKTSNCAEPAPAETLHLTFSQNGNSITVTDERSNTFYGTLNGYNLTWSGHYDETAPDGTPGVTTLNSMTANFDSSCNNLSGSANWTWSATDGSYSCSGQTTFSGSRSPADGCAVVDIPAAPSGLNAYATSSGSVQLDWMDNSDNEDEYIIERSDVSSTSGYGVVGTLAPDTHHFDDSGLVPSTTYYYRVAAANASGQSDYSNVASATTQAAPLMAPAAPSDLGGSALSSTSVSLTWTDNSDNEAQFEIYQATDLGGPYTRCATVSANVVTSNINGLAPATGYAFKVIAVNSAGSSTDSNVFEITTPAAPLNVPTAPTGLNISSATTSSLTLSWSDNSDNEDGFHIYRATTQFGVYAQIGTTASTVYVNSGLNSATTYWYKVAAYNDVGESTYTSAISGTTDAIPDVVPEAPSNLTVGSASSSSLTLSWDDNSNNEDGFRIYRSTTQFGTYTQIATAANTGYVNTGLGASTTYWYKVAAYNAVGESAPTTEASGSTLAPPSLIPAAPSNPTVSNITGSAATLSWTDNSDNEQGFQIGTCNGLVSVNGNGDYSCVTGFNQIAQVSANVTSYVLTGLSEETEYYRFVRAYNSSGSSANTGFRFTTATGQRTITLSVVANNIVQSNSLDNTWANTVYRNYYPAVGIMWASSILDFPSKLAYAGLVKFDVSALQGKTIDSAVLDLEARQAPVGYYPQDFTISAVASSWNDTTVTWNLMSSFQYYTQSWQTLAYPIYSGQTYDVNLTSTVQSWVNGYYANNGLAFMSTSYSYFPGNINSFDQYEFELPTLTVTYH